MVGNDLGPLLQGQPRIGKLKIAYNLFIIGPTAIVTFRFSLLRKSLGS